MNDARNFDPYRERPRDSQGSIASRILQKTAMLLSQGLQPFAEVQPTDTVSSFSNVVAAGATTNGIPIQFPCDGLVVGLRVSVADGTSLSYGSTLLRVQQDGDTELFPSASGGGPGYLSLSQISGNAQLIGRYLTRRPFQQATFWSIFLQNRQPAIVTSVGAASNGQASPGTGNAITVATTVGFPAQGYLSIAGIAGLVSYTGVTATTFTGTLGGTGTLATGAAVTSTTGAVTVDVGFDIVRTTNLRTS
jgi:hypothetical protein